MGSGVRFQEKKCSGPRSKSTHSGCNTQRSFDPPPPPDPTPPKWGTRYRGVGGSKSKNSLGNHFSSQNGDFTMGWTSIPQLWLWYANDAQGGGYTTPAPAVDLTTFLRGDFFSQCFQLLKHNVHTIRVVAWVAATAQPGIPTLAAALSLTLSYPCCHSPKPQGEEGQKGAGGGRLAGESGGCSHCSCCSLLPPWPRNLLM